MNAMKNQPDEIDALARDLATADRDTCVNTLKSVAWPPLDFTDEFLSRVNLDRLRHIALAACMQAARSKRTSA